MEKIPSYLRSDLPTGDWLLRPSPGHLLIPTGHLDITLIPRSPRYTKKELRQAKRRRKKELNKVDVFRESLTFEEEMEERRKDMKEEADQKLWNKVLDDQRNKKMKEMCNDKQKGHQKDQSLDGSNQYTTITDNNIKNATMFIDKMPKSETPGKRFLKDLNMQLRSSVQNKGTKELDAKITAIRVVFEKSLRAGGPTSPISPQSSRKSPKTRRIAGNIRKTEHHLENSNNYDDLDQNNDDNNDDSNEGNNPLTMMKSAVITKLLAFKHCIDFKNAVDARYKLLKLMGGWGTHTRSVILVQRVFRRKVERVRQRSIEKIRKFIVYWLYKSQRTLKRKSSILIRQFLMDIQEHFDRRITFAVKKFQYKVKKCQKFVRSYLQIKKARILCFRKTLDRLEKSSSIAALCEEFSEVKVALQHEILGVFKYFQAECLRKQKEWKVKAKNKLLAWNMTVDEDDVRMYLISNDDADPQFVRKTVKDDPYPSMCPVYSSRHLKVKLIEALEKAKATIVVIQTAQVKKKVKKVVSDELNLAEITPKDLVTRVDKFLHNLKNNKS